MWGFHTNKMFNTIKLCILLNFSLNACFIIYTENYLCGFRAYLARKKCMFLKILCFWRILFSDNAMKKVNRWKTKIFNRGELRNQQKWASNHYKYFSFSFLRSQIEYLQFDYYLLLILLSTNTLLCKQTAKTAHSENECTLKYIMYKIVWAACKTKLLSVFVSVFTCRWVIFLFILFCSV